MQEVYIYDAIRTPRGRRKAGGALNEIEPTALAAGLLDARKERNTLDTSRVDDVVPGCVSPVLDQGFDIGRGAVLLSSWDHSVPGVQVDPFCASGLEVVQLGAQRIRSGSDQLIVAGGVDSMSRVPARTGGVHRFVDQIGIEAFVVRANELADRHGERFRAPDGFATKTGSRSDKLNALFA